jgi:hypothetical protein
MSWRRNRLLQRLSITEKKMIPDTIQCYLPMKNKSPVSFSANQIA